MSEGAYEIPEGNEEAGGTTRTADSRLLRGLVPGARGAIDGFAVPATPSAQAQAQPGRFWKQERAGEKGETEDSRFSDSSLCPRPGWGLCSGKPQWLPSPQVVTISLQELLGLPPLQSEHLRRFPGRRDEERDLGSQEAAGSGGQAV